MLTCNIDSRGKSLRLVNGVVLIIVGIALTGFWAVPSHSTLAWIVSVICLAGGAFAVFEARAGWCALRAMGIKTRV